MSALSPILYAEDEENDVYFLQRAFADASITNPLVIVRSGDAAVDYLSGEGDYADRVRYPLPCLALLDLNLPGKSGLEVLKWIRAQPSLCTLPVLMLTSSTQESDIHRAYVQGANGFLIKPGKPAELLAMVKALGEFWLVHNCSDDRTRIGQNVHI